MLEGLKKIFVWICIIGKRCSCTFWPHGGTRSPYKTANFCFSPCVCHLLVCRFHPLCVPRNWLTRCCIWGMSLQVKRMCGWPLKPLRMGNLVNRSIPVCSSKGHFHLKVNWNYAVLNINTNYAVFQHILYYSNCFEEMYFLFNYRTTSSPKREGFGTSTTVVYHGWSKFCIFVGKEGAQRRGDWHLYRWFHMIY